MFSALRQGNPFYMLEKGEKPSLKVGQVESVSLPKPKYGTYNPSLTFGMNMETVVDITVKEGDQKLEFKQVPSSLSIANFGDKGMVISESREAMTAEIDGMLQSSRQVLNSIDYHKAVIDSCEEMLKQLNPSFAKEQERDDAIDSLTSQVNSIRSEFGTIKGDVSKILGLLTRAEAPKPVQL